jgi:hypothetical protein
MRNKLSRSSVIYLTGLLIVVLTFIIEQTITLPPGTGLAVSLLIIFLSILADIRVFLQEDVREALAFDKLLYKDRWLKTQLEPIISKYTKIAKDHQNSPSRETSIPYKLARYSIQECVKELTDYEQKRWLFTDFAQRVDLLIETIGVTQQTVFATSDTTSDVSLGIWWDSHHGRKYLEENIKAVKRGVKLERIFIANQSVLNANKETLEDSKKLLSLIKQHESVGATVMIVIQEKLPMVTTMNNILLCDNDFTMWSTFTDAGIASYNEEDLQKASAEYRRVSFFAKPPGDFPFYSKLDEAG